MVALDLGRAQCRRARGIEAQLVDALTQARETIFERGPVLCGERSLVKHARSRNAADGAESHAPAEVNFPLIIVLANAPLTGWLAHELPP